MKLKLFDAIGYLKTDSSHLKTGMKNAEGLVGKSLMGMRTAFNKFVKYGALAFAGLAAAVAAFTAKVVMMGSDAMESENLFTVSMGKMAVAAREWSKEYAEALKQNEFAIRKNLGTFNVMLKSMGLGEQAAYEMAKALTKLALDIASFYNLSPEEAFTKLTAGISGEIEPLKRLGILVNVFAVEQTALAAGVTKSYTAMTQAEKVMWRYRTIMEATTAAQGDMARTLDFNANVLRSFREQMTEAMQKVGMALQEPAGVFFKAMREMATRLSDSITENEDSIITHATAIAEALSTLLTGSQDTAKTYAEDVQADIKKSYEDQLIKTEGFSGDVLARIVAHNENVQSGMKKALESSANALGKVNKDLMDKINADLDESHAAARKKLRENLEALVDILGTMVQPFGRVGLDIGKAMGGQMVKGIREAIRESPWLGGSWGGRVVTFLAEQAGDYAGRDWVAERDAENARYLAERGQVRGPVAPWLDAQRFGTANFGAQAVRP